MKNAEYLSKQGIKLSSFYMYETTNHTYTIRNSDPNKQFGTVNADTPYSAIHEFMEWLDMEHTEQILDKVERQYLSSVIKPFKKRAVFVRKDCHKGLDGGRYEQIVIRVKSAMPDSFADIELPFFKEGAMYKGMKIYKEYTMKELGL